VTGFTESHEITLLITSAFGEGEDVVYLFGRGESTLFLALLTKGMRLDVTVTDAFPSTTISFIGDWVTFMLVVMFVHCLLMLGTVLFTFSKPTATGISTRTLWFVGHHFTSLLGIEKALQDEPTRLGIYSILLII